MSTDFSGKLTVDVLFWKWLIKTYIALIILKSIILIVPYQEQKYPLNYIDKNISAIEVMNEKIDTIYDTTYNIRRYKNVKMG